jgi:hypothetical protein
MSGAGQASRSRNAMAWQRILLPVGAGQPEGFEPQTCNLTQIKEVAGNGRGKRRQIDADIRGWKTHDHLAAARASR